MFITKTRFGRSAPDDVGVMTGMHLIAAEGQPLHVAVSRRSSEVGSEKRSPNGWRFCTSYNQ